MFPAPAPRPVYDRLIDAWEAYLRGVHELTASMFPPDWKFAQWVPWLLWRSIMQRARVIHLDLKLGYSEEALDHARPMISATMILCLIVGSSNPGGWALRYYVEITKRDHDFIDQQLKLGRFSADYAERKHKEADEAYAEAVRGAKERDNIALPDKLAPAPADKNKNPKPDDRSWSGLSDRGLAVYLGPWFVEWYDEAYSYTSNIAHVQSMALREAMQHIIDGKVPPLGPMFEWPLPPLAVAVDAVHVATHTLAGYVGQSHLPPNLAALRQTIDAALDDFRNASGFDEYIAEAKAEAAPPPPIDEGSPSS